MTIIREENSYVLDERLSIVNYTLKTGSILCKGATIAIF